MSKNGQISKSISKTPKQISSCDEEAGGQFEKLVSLLSFIDKLYTSFYLYDRKQVLETTVKYVHEFFDCEAVTLFLVDEHDHRFLIKEANHADQDLQEGRRDVRLKIQSVKGAGLTGHIAKQGKIVRIHGDELLNNPYVKNKKCDFLTSGFCTSILAIPLKDRKGRLIGLLNNHNKKNAQGKPDKGIGFSKLDQEIAELLANKVVVLLENKRAYEIFQCLIEDIQAARNLKEALTAIQTRAKVLLRADRVNIALWSRIKGQLVMEGKKKAVSEIRPRKWIAVPKQSVIYNVWHSAKTSVKERRTESNDDICFIPNVAKTSYKCSPKTLSVLAILLRAHGTRIGVLNLESFRVDGFDDLDQWTLRMLEQNASIAIQAIGEQSRLLDELDFRLRSLLPSEEILDVILENALELYGLEAGLIYLADYEAETLKCVAYRDSQKVEGDYHNFIFKFQKKSVATQIFHSHKPFFSRNVRKDSAFAQAELEFFNIHGSLAGWPLVFEGAIVGVLIVWNHDNPGPTRDHIERLKPFARLAAIHIARGQSAEIGNKLLTELNMINQNSSAETAGFLETRYLRLIWIGIQAAGFERARVFKYDRKNDSFVCQISYGEDPNEYHNVKFRVDSSPYAMALKGNIHRLEARLYDPTDPTLYGPDANAKKFGKPLDLPWAVVPIVIGSTLCGQIVADNAYTKKPITKHSIQILTDLGGLISQIILQRQQAETEMELKESQDLYRSLVRNIPVVMWRKDLQFRFTYVNGLFCKTIEKNKKDIIGKTDYDLFTKVFADRFRKGDEQIIKKKKKIFEDDSEPFPLPSGEVHFIHVIKIPLYDQLGKIIGTQGMFLDVNNDTFRKLFEEAPIGYHEIDREGKFIHVNQTEQEMLGFSFEEMHSKHFWNFVPKDERNVTKKIVLDLLSDQTAPQEAYALNLQRKDKTTVPVLANHHILRDSEGRITGLLTAVEKIGPGIEIAQALQNPDPRYLAHIKELQFPVFCKDRKSGKFTFVNDAFLADCGASNREDVIGKTDIDLYGPKIGREYQRIDRIVTEHDEAVVERIELHPLPRGKQSFVVHVLKFPVRNSQGRITGLQGIFWKPEDNELAMSALNDALKKAQEDYRHIVNNAVEGIFQSTLEGRFIGVNPALVSMLGYDSPEDLLSVKDIGREIYINPKDREEFIQKICGPDNEVRNLEYEIRRKDGTKIWISESARIIKDDNHNIRYLEGFIQDITKRKQDEDIIRHALEEKDELLREMQHRVRNILLNMGGLIRIGRNKLVSKGRTEGVAEEVLQETEERIRAMKLVHEVLLEAKNYKISMRDFIDKLTENLVQSYKRKTLKIERYVKVDDITMGSSTAQACAFIINDLISNSMKHAFPGRASGRIAITLKRIQKRGTYSLVVSDNGIGLPENINVKKSTTTGLILVNSFVKKLHGKLQINRTGGTNFMITFNIKKNSKGDSK